MIMDLNLDRNVRSLNPPFVTGFLILPYHPFVTVPLDIEGIWLKYLWVFNPQGEARLALEGWIRLSECRILFSGKQVFSWLATWLAMNQEVTIWQKFLLSPTKPLKFGRDRFGVMLYKTDVCPDKSQSKLSLVFIIIWSSNFLSWSSLI